jgi:hypothetical protein
VKKPADNFDLVVPGRDWETDYRCHLVKGLPSPCGSNARHQITDTGDKLNDGRWPTDYWVSSGGTGMSTSFPLLILSSGRLAAEPAGAIQAVPGVVTFATITAGDTTSVSLTIRNAGKGFLTVSGFEPGAYPIRLSPEPPFSIPPGDSVAAQLFLESTEAIEIVGELRLTSSDPSVPRLILPVIADVRALEFDWVSSDIYPTREVSQGQEIGVQVIMRDLVEVDEMRLHYRESGSVGYDSIPMPRAEDHELNDRYLAWTPRTLSGRRGAEFFVWARNGAVTTTLPSRDSPWRFRVRIQDATFVQRAAQYRMMSIPFECDPTPVYMALEDDLGPASAVRWRCFYHGGAERYTELLPGDPLPFVQGRAYWLVTAQDEEVDTSPIEALLSTPADSSFALSLEPDWNMIANPFAFPVAWSDVLIDGIPTSQDTVTTGPCSWNADSSAYEHDRPVLEPFEGYWVHAGGQGVDLRIPPVETAASNAALGPAQDDEVGEAWKLEIAVFSRDARARGTFAGMVTTAHEEWDAHDRRAPPAPPGKALAVYFPHENWSIRAGSYAWDMRPPPPPDSASRMAGPPGSGEAGVVWRFGVIKSFVDREADDEVTLEFPGIDDVPPEQAVRLIDGKLSRTTDLRAQHRYTFLQGKMGYVPEEDARFCLLVGTESFVRTVEQELGDFPKSTYLHPNRPNPFRSSTVLRFDLRSDGPVQLGIYDIRGAEVKTLWRGQHERGAYEILWDGTDERGSKVAAGVYFLKLRTEESVETRKLTAVR